MPKKTELEPLVNINSMLLGLSIALGAVAPASAAQTPAVPGAAAAPAPKAPVNATLMAYDKFTQNAAAQKGLFTVWRTKDGNVALELTPEQFGADFIELPVPVNGIGSGLFSGLTDLQACRIMRFVHQDNRVAILFPTTRFFAKPNSPEANAVAAGVTNSMAGVAKVISVDEKTGDVVFDASPFLQDITGVADFLTELNGGRQLNPMGAYHMDPQQTYFGGTKAFPENVTLTANQTFSSMSPQYISDAAPDPRNLQIAMQYTIAALPANGNYLPRAFDDRVGYFTNAHDDFSSDDSFDKSADYIVRWNVQASSPAQRLSPAKKPIVYYISNTIPVKYRFAVRRALLTWNNAFRAIGITDAVEVKDQPNDPNFDPDDMRYNVVRWLAETDGGFAEAQLLYNPYTGEMLKSGIVIDSDLMRYGKTDYPIDVQPQAGVRPGALGAEFAQGERAQFSYGMSALSIMGSGDGYHVPAKFANQFLESIVLHESGHDFGLRHNYLGSQAYTGVQLRSPAFTQKYGTAASVMEYVPINIWPKHMGQGEYFQTVLGPYDYYAIHWGYAPIAGAKTPHDELPVLRRWASAWSNPRFAYSSDEDVQWTNGSSVDPRNQQWDLSSDTIGWCQTQMGLSHALLAKAGSRFPQAGRSYSDLQFVLGSLMGQYGRCTGAVARYIGGEYVSRARRGDAHAALPLSAVPKSQQARAFKVLETNLFAAQAWNVPPALLRQAVSQYLFDDWDGHFAPRHDMAVEQIAAAYQRSAMNRMFAPVTLQRLDDVQNKYPAKTTMDIADLFGWMQSAAFADISHPAAGSIPLVRRNLQRNYAAMLSRLANDPPSGTPQDAQALARYELKALSGQIETSLGKNKLDLLTRAHLASLDTDVQRSLHAQAVLGAVR
ncbi:MAG: zinc-dependent metalloprotease [Candidatus Baltobacteraceae bacterium]